MTDLYHGTPLPWRARPDNTISNNVGQLVAVCGNAKDTEYLAHAARSYPLLCGMLRDLVLNADPQGYMATLERGRVMLEALGETRTW